MASQRLKTAKMPRKATKKRDKTRRAKKRKRTAITGLDRPFFLDGASKLAGFMRIYKPPRWTDEYFKMDDRDLFRRIRDDLEELLARAYPTYTEEREQRFCPNLRRPFPTAYADRLRTRLHEPFVEELCPGLMKRIQSRSVSESRAAIAEYQTLVDQWLTEEPQHAADELAFIATWLTTDLENLFVKRPALMRKVAAKHDLWPVNLGRRGRIVRGKPKHHVTRLSFARTYLSQLEVNSRCDIPSQQGSGAEQTSPFKLAAQDLYSMMLLEKEMQGRPNGPNAWEKRLFALTVPMTKRTALDWWKVAKIYLHERWDRDTAHSEFTPLIKHVGLEFLSSKIPYESMIKSRVIDNDLKDAFTGLAQADL